MNPRNLAPLGFSILSLSAVLAGACSSEPTQRFGHPEAGAGGTGAGGAGGEGGAGHAGNAGEAGNAGQAGGAGAPPTSCASSADCSEPRPYCDGAPRACVECAYDAHCDVRSVCERGVCVELTRCESDGDCTLHPARYLCEPALGACVECLRAEDCSATADCARNRCVPYVACDDSRDCGQDQVCDAQRGRCVDCVGDFDCGGGGTCVDHECVTRSACVSDKDCKALGQLCNRSQGVCVDCLHHDDCEALEHCDDGRCELDLCWAGSSECVGNATLTCNSAGSEERSMPCSHGTTCAGEARAASCAPWVCDAGMTYCDSGEMLIECSSDGLALTSSTDCSASGLYCVNAKCQSRRCEPDSTFCEGKSVMQCNGTGLDAWPIQTCGDKQFCDGYWGYCRTQLCEPGKALCNGELATTCNGDGSGPVDGGMDCAAKGLSCVDGQCSPCSARGPVEALRFVEMYVGEDDYVIVANPSTCPVQYEGLRFSVRTSSGTGESLDYSLPEGALAPGAAVAIMDQRLAKTGDLVPTDNIFFTDATSDYAMLCDGPCNSSTIIDLVSHSSTDKALPGYPHGVSFAPDGLTGITAKNSVHFAYVRSAFDGSAPGFLASDWTVGDASRVEDPKPAPTCPATQPANGAQCVDLISGCVYGSVTCACDLNTFFKWSCQ